jgi:hypothetical protein
MRYTELNIPTDSRVPDGYALVLAYARGDEVVIPIDPRGLPEDDHSCDWEGCGSIGHVLRITPQQKYALERAAQSAEVRPNTIQQAQPAICAPRIAGCIHAQIVWRCNNGGDCTWTAHKQQAGA